MLPGKEREGGGRCFHGGAFSDSERVPVRSESVQTFRTCIKCQTYFVLMCVEEDLEFKPFRSSWFACEF